MNKNYFIFAFLIFEIKNFAYGQVENNKKNNNIKNNNDREYDDRYDDRPRPYPNPPLVTVNNANGYDKSDGKHVGVNIPGIYEMGLLAGGQQGVGMAINVLSGLVRVNLNRNRDPITGRKSGPISVEVAGIPVFRGAP